MLDHRGDQPKQTPSLAPVREKVNLLLTLSRSTPIPSGLTRTNALAGVHLFLAKILSLSDRKHQKGAPLCAPSEELCRESEIEGGKDPLTVPADKVEEYVRESSTKLKNELESYVIEVTDGLLRECRRRRIDYVAAQEKPRDPDSAVITGNDSAWTCSGVLIADNVVLTAAHCLPLTKVLWTEDAEKGGETRAVVETARHPRPDVDMALLRLATPVGKKAAFLRAATDTIAPEGVLRFVGFGATSADGKSGFGKKHFLDLQASGWGCDGDRALRTGCKQGTEMVLPASMGRDTCFGDSGGPVFEIWGDGAQCGFRLVAIAARRTADSVVPCGNGGIYTRVDVVRAWIDAAITAWKPVTQAGEHE